MADQVQPKADQPRVSTESLKRGESSPNLQYRVNAIKEPRNVTTRSYGRSKRS
jgi:hypothetical protein